MNFQFKRSSRKRFGNAHKFIPHDSIDLKANFTYQHVLVVSYASYFRLRVFCGPCGPHVKYYGSEKIIFVRTHHEMPETQLSGNLYDSNGCFGGGTKRDILVKFVDLTIREDLN